jgi:hypothetical protein
MKLYIAEKPSLGRAIADVLPRPHRKADGSIRRIKGLSPKNFFQYPDALHALNQAMAIQFAQITLALVHLQILCGRFQAVAHRIPCRPNIQWRPG